MQKTFDFYFDVVSPYAYLAATQIDVLCRRTGATCVWRPFLLGAVMHATGNKPPLEVFVPPKRAWFLGDPVDWAAHYGVPFKFPQPFPFNSLKAQRMLVAAAELDKTRELALHFYARFWGEGRPLVELTDLAESASSIGLDGKALSERAESAEVKAQLKFHGDEALKRGAFGAPTFVYENKLYWGNDRMTLLESHLQR
jgi:2-hydroxychromene-2-carboxylate isomerase